MVVEVSVQINAHNRTAHVSMYAYTIGRHAGWTISEADSGMFSVSEIDLDGRKRKVDVEEVHVYVSSRIMAMAGDSTDDTVEQVGLVSRLLMLIF